MSIVIKELFGSDTISTLVEKINQNFDALYLQGGAEGPQGERGIQGIAGPRGIRGSQWFGVTGTTTINEPTDGIFRENDFRILSNGNIDIYDGTIWKFSEINLLGPQGIPGPQGDGSISILPGAVVPNPGQSEINQWTPETENFTGHINRSGADSDDKKTSGSPFFNSGLDFVAIGKGNNSLTLGRYTSLFFSGATTGDIYKPAGTNSVAHNFPASESEVPMLIVLQNDYKNPLTPNNTYSNGISIGLNKTHPNSEYSTNDPLYGQPLDFNKFANISIENKFYDLKISGSNKITLRNSLPNGTTFVLGANFNRGDTTSVHDISTKLNSGSYTEFNITDSLVFDLSGTGGSGLRKGLISKSDFNYSEIKKSYTNDKDIRTKLSKTFISSDTFENNGANEIVLMNKTLLGELTSGQQKDIGRIINNYFVNTESDSNDKRLPLRIGQTVINARKHNGESIDESNQANIHISYQGFGYDQPFIQYSSIDSFYGGIDNINTDVNFSAFNAVLPNNLNLEKEFGYDIREPFKFQAGSRSVARIGLYPGFFRQEKEQNTTGAFLTSDSTVQNRKNKFFDLTHKMMPTGSMDLFGTIRLREQETTDNGNKDGWVAVNKKNGVIGFEPPNKVNAVPTYSVMMFSELASDKFSFYTVSTRPLGSGATGRPAWHYRSGQTGLCAAFIGKGSGELQDYYICNGAVLADERDILVTGPYSKMTGMNVIANGVSYNNGVLDTEIFKWNINDKFLGKKGETTNLFLDKDGNNLANTFITDLNAKGLFSRSDLRYGYSILAPEKVDSGYRIVLPNYFGKVPKMVFPDSDFIRRAVSGNTMTWLGVKLPEQTVDSGFRLLNTKHEYNPSWMMKGSFESLGSPYLRVKALPLHEHDITIPLDSGFKSLAADTFYSLNSTIGPFLSSGRVSYFDEYEQWKNTTIGFGEQNNYIDSFGIQDYNLNSNWYDNGQTFLEPPFKGTYMAVNLKGAFNPARGSTIKNLHYVCGVPICGLPNDSYDMSWYSSTGNYGDTLYTTYSTEHTQKTKHYEYGFKAMARNDSHSHPYTYYREDDYSDTTPLEYNNTVYVTGDPRRLQNDLYKSNAKKPNNHFDI